MKVNETILRKLQKLFRLSNDKGATEAEAMTALAMAQKMLAEHHLSMADVDEYARDKDGASSGSASWTLKREALKPRKRFFRYETLLQVAAKCFCGVEAVEFNRQGLVSLVFIGEEHDVALAVVIYDELIQAVRRLARANYGEGWRSGHRCFAEGFAERVMRRCYEKGGSENFAKAEQQKYEMVIQRKEDWLSQQLAAELPDLTRRTMKQGRATNLDAWARGDAEGRNVSLTKNGLGAPSR